MKVEININKWHFFVILSFVILVGFAIAQSQNTPNPGHDVSQLSGVAPSCSSSSFSNGDSSCTASTNNNWTPRLTAARSSYSYNSLKLGGIDVQGFCKSDGSNCRPLSAYLVDTTTKCSSGTQPVQCITDSPDSAFTWYNRVSYERFRWNSNLNKWEYQYYLPNNFLATAYCTYVVCA